MPGIASWNGKWSGEKDLYALVQSFPGKRGEEKAGRILSRHYYSYNFGDGWRAAIEVRAVGPAESKRLRKLSKGFCGYDWMVDSIIQDGAIYGPTQPKPEMEAA